jgi:hypothetical protein
MADDARPQNDALQVTSAQEGEEHSTFTSEELDRAILEYNEERQVCRDKADNSRLMLMLIDLDSGSTSPLQTNNSSDNSPYFALL